MSNVEPQTSSGCEGETKRGGVKHVTEIPMKEINKESENVPINLQTLHLSKASHSPEMISLCNNAKVKVNFISCDRNDDLGGKDLISVIKKIVKFTDIEKEFIKPEVLYEDLCKTIKSKLGGSEPYREMIKINSSEKYHIQTDWSAIKHWFKISETRSETLDSPASQHGDSSSRRKSQHKGEKDSDNCHVGVPKAADLNVISEQSDINQIYIDVIKSEDNYTIIINFDELILKKEKINGLVYKFKEKEITKQRNQQRFLLCEYDIVQLIKESVE